MSLINDALKQARHHAGSAGNEPGRVAASVPPRHSAGASSRRGWLFVFGGMLLPLLLAGGIGAGLYIHARWGDLLRQVYRRGDAAMQGSGGQGGVPESVPSKTEPTAAVGDAIVEADVSGDGVVGAPLWAPLPALSAVPEISDVPVAAVSEPSSDSASAEAPGGASADVAAAVPVVSRDAAPDAAVSAPPSAAASAEAPGAASGAAAPAVGGSVESVPVASDSPNTAATSVAPGAAAPAAAAIAGEDVAVEGGGEAEAAEPGSSAAGSSAADKAVPQGLPPEIRMRYRLSGIMSWENRRLGIINGNFYTEGEDLGGGFRLVSIAERHVVIGSGETQYNLRLGN